MRYKYYYCLISNSELLAYLDSNKIRYKLTGGILTPEFVKFSLWSSSKSTMSIVNDLKIIFQEEPLVFVEYTDSELSQAKLLTMQPQKECIEIINSREAFECSCVRVDAFGMTRTRHMRQVDLLTIAKEPSAKSKAVFWTSDTGFSEIYVNQCVRELVSSNNMLGVDFLQIRRKDGKYCDNLFQMTSQNSILQECIAFGYGEQRLLCPMCGKEQFYIDNTFQLHLSHLNALPKSDLYITERIWGEGIPYPMYLISQHFYQLLKQQGFTSSVTFSPVVEV